jgi:2-polyprenyl-3-methyl-5-hydroxy-6-metoxy-1,4-benzoquinol methylase
MIEVEFADNIESPFGGRSRPIQIMDVHKINAMYVAKCGTDISRCFKRAQQIALYECEETGYRFWRPAEVAGDEAFYRQLSGAWPNYYRLKRWEHPFAVRFLQGRANILEIGCGPGHFLKVMEQSGANAIGIESNREAVMNKVTRFPIVADFDALPDALRGRFDAVYAFQVLEHVPDPCELIERSLQLIGPNGILIFSTPNNDFGDFRRQLDPFDLPPHHIGHFNADIYRRIAHKMNMNVLGVFSQRAAVGLEFGLETDPWINRLGKRAGSALRVARRLLRREPGPNILVVYGRL